MEGLLGIGQSVAVALAYTDTFSVYTGTISLTVLGKMLPSGLQDPPIHPLNLVFALVSFSSDVSSSEQ